MKQKRGTDTQTLSERLPRLTGGEKKTDPGMTGSSSLPAPARTGGCCGAGLRLRPLPGALRASDPAGAPAARDFQTVLPPFSSSLLFSFCHFLLLYLLERHLRFEINQPREQHLFFFFLKSILASWEARRQRGMGLGEGLQEKEGGGVSAG